MLWMHHRTEVPTPWYIMGCMVAVRDLLLDPRLYEKGEILLIKPSSAPCSILPLKFLVEPCVCSRLVSEVKRENKRQVSYLLEICDAAVKTGNRHSCRINVKVHGVKTNSSQNTCLPPTCPPQRQYAKEQSWKCVKEGVGEAELRAWIQGSWDKLSLGKKEILGNVHVCKEK